MIFVILVSRDSQNCHEMLYSFFVSKSQLNILIRAHNLLEQNRNELCFQMSIKLEIIVTHHGFENRLICLLGALVFPVSKNFRLQFETVPKMWYLIVSFNYNTRIYSKCGITIDVTPETCILVMLSDHFNVMNTCIIIIKYFLFTCKLQNTIPVFRECVEEIKYSKKLDIYNYVFGCLVVKTRVIKLNCNQV